jgi:hypothetical protein
MASSEKEFFKNAYARIYHDPELDALVLQYISKVPGHEQFVEINQAVLKAFKQLNTTRFIADIRKMGIISLQSQEWVVSTLLPGLIKHLAGKPLWHAQLLDSNEIMSRVSGNNIKNKSTSTSKDIEVIQFSSEDELRKYCLEHKHP